MFILIGLTIISAIILIISFMLNSLEFKTVSICIFTLVLFLGWGLWGSISVCKKTYEDITCSYCKTKSRVLIETIDGKDTTIVSDAYSYNSIDDSTEFQIEHSFNLYNIELYSTVVIKP